MNPSTRWCDLTVAQYLAINEGSTWAHIAIVALGGLLVFFARGWWKARHPAPALASAPAFIVGAPVTACTRCGYSGENKEPGRSPPEPSPQYPAPKGDPFDGRGG